MEQDLDSLESQDFDSLLQLIVEHDEDEQQPPKVFIVEQELKKSLNQKLKSMIIYFFSLDLLIFYYKIFLLQH